MSRDSDIFPEDKVVVLDDFRAHFVINDINGDCHVVPEAVVQQWISGKVRPPLKIVRAIIKEWADDLM